MNLLGFYKVDHRLNNRNIKLQKNDTEIDSGYGPIDNSQIEIIQTSNIDFTNTDQSSLPNLTTNESVTSQDVKGKISNVVTNFTDSNIKVSKY